MDGYTSKRKPLTNVCKEGLAVNGTTYRKLRTPIRTVNCDIIDFDNKQSNRHSEEIQHMAIMKVCKQFPEFESRLLPCVNIRVGNRIDTARNLLVDISRNAFRNN